MSLIYVVLTSASYEACTVSDEVFVAACATRGAADAYVAASHDHFGRLRIEEQEVFEADPAPEDEAVEGEREVSGRAPAGGAINGK